MQKGQFLFVLSLIFAVLVTVFALTNSNPVVIRFFTYQFSGSLALVIFISAVVGALVVMLLGTARFIGLKMEMKRMNKDRDGLNKDKDVLVKQIADLQKKIDDMNASAAVQAASAAQAASKVQTADAANGEPPVSTN